MRRPAKRRNPKGVKRWGLASLILRADQRGVSPLRRNPAAALSAQAAELLALATSGAGNRALLSQFQRPARGLQAAMETLRRDRQPAKPRPAKPSAISAHVEGSGTGLTVRCPALTTSTLWFNVQLPTVLVNRLKSFPDDVVNETRPDSDEIVRDLRNIKGLPGR
jgi:hypothetical protein